MRQTFFLIFCICSISLSSIANTARIKVANYSFTPDKVDIRLGDTIIFEWVSGTHEIISLNMYPPTAKPWTVRLSAANPTFIYVPESTGLCDFKATNHPNSVMTGTIRIIEPKFVGGGMYPWLWWPAGIITNYLHINLDPKNPPFDIYIYDARRKELFINKNTSGSELIIDVSSWPKGLYEIIVVLNKNGGMLHMSIRIKM